MMPVKTCASCGKRCRTCASCGKRCRSAVCADCAARGASADLALSGGRWVAGPGGVRRWVTDELPRKPRAKPGPKPKPIPCGTENGYQAHRRRGPWPLDRADVCGCLAAHRDHVSRRYHEKKGRAELAAAALSVSAVHPEKEVA